MGLFLVKIKPSFAFSAEQQEHDPSSIPGIFNVYVADDGKIMNSKDQIAAKKQAVRYLQKDEAMRIRGRQLSETTIGVHELMATHVKELRDLRIDLSNKIRDSEAATAEKLATFQSEMSKTFDESLSKR